MKTYLTLILLFTVSQLFAQTYPYKDGFSQEASGQVPNGWGGNAQVYLDHGFNTGKALAGKINSIFTDQNSITPLIGPLTAHSTLVFYFRIVDQYIYPSTPTTFYAGDSFNMQISVNGVPYQTAFSITATNHTPNLNFKQQKVFLGQFAGSTVNIQFAFHFGGTGAGYYVDIDTVAVYNDPFAAIANVEDEMGLTIFPNPLSAGKSFTLQMDDSYKENSFLEVFDATGRKSFSCPPANAHLSDLTAGIYFLKLTSQNKTVTRKLVVE